jgi:hypothetical protein
VKVQSFTTFAAARGITFSPGQSVAFRVLFDGVDPGGFEDKDDASLALSLFGAVAQPVPPIAREVAVIVKGARIGGSRFSSLRALHLALTVDLSTLAPGEDAFVLFVAPDMRLARQTMRYALGAVRADPTLRRLIEGEPSRDGFTIRRRSGGPRVTFECLPATRGGSAVRARSIVCAVLSEAAFFRDKDYAINDAEIYRAIAPRVLPGGQTILESTPWLESGLLYELYRDNWGDPSTALVAHAPTLTMRPDARTQAIVEAERKRDPDNAQREFDALFVGGGAVAFFDEISLKNAIQAERPTVSFVKAGWRAGAGGDLALISDSSALAIVGYDGTARYELLQVEEKRPEKGKPLKLSAVIKDFATTLRAHRLRAVTLDGHHREPAREYTDEEKITIVAAPEGQDGKYETYRAVRDALREGRMIIHDDPRMLAQFRAVVARPQPGGGMKISSPRTRAGHGDLVSAIVLAVHDASNGARVSIRHANRRARSDSRWDDSTRGF